MITHNDLIDIDIPNFDKKVEDLNAKIVKAQDFISENEKSTDDKILVKVLTSKTRLFNLEQQLKDLDARFNELRLEYRDFISGYRLALNSAKELPILEDALKLVSQISGAGFTHLGPFSYELDLKVKDCKNKISYLKYLEEKNPKAYEMLSNEK